MPKTATRTTFLVGKSLALSIGCMLVIRSPADHLAREPPGFESSAVAFQPELLQMTQQGHFIQAQTLPLNNSAVVSALLSEAQNPDFVSPLVIAPYLVPPSPPPPQRAVSHFPS